MAIDHTGKVREGQKWTDGEGDGDDNGNRREKERACLCRVDGEGERARKGCRDGDRRVIGEG